MKILKIILSCLSVVALSAFFVFNVITSYVSDFKLSAYADNGSSDVLTYNINPFYHVNETVVDGGLTIVYDNGTVHISGTASSVFSVPLIDDGDYGSVSNTTYCVFNDKSVDPHITFNLFGDFGSRSWNGYASNWVLFVPNSSSGSVNSLVAFLEIGYTYDIVLKPMMITGQYNYVNYPPFQPNLTYFLNDFSGGGGGSGSGDYDQGYADGLEFAKYGVFLNSTFNASITYDNVASPFTVSNIVPNFSYNSVNFYTVWEHCGQETGNGDSAESGVFTLNFSEPFIFSSTFSFYGVGNSLVTDMVLIDISGNRYPGSFDYSHGGIFSLDGNSPSNAISAAEISMGRVVDLSNDFWLYSDTGNYQSGYDNGYLEGHSAGLDEGYTNGYNAGYSDGLNSSVTGDIFQNPISAFLKPVSDFINTDIFGSFSIGDGFSVVFFVMIALIFIKMFAGG